MRTLYKLSVMMLLVRMGGIPAYGQVADPAKSIPDDFVEIRETNNDVVSIFKTSRIANGHSVKQITKGVLDVRINHRFGRINNGINNFFGLDNAVTRIGFDYGVTDYFMVGIGRSTLNKEYDAFGKILLLRQKKVRAPVTVDYLAGLYIVTEKYNVDKLAFGNRLTYLNQLLVARKFKERLSLQLMPTLIHFNMTQYTGETNTLAALGFGGRYKLTKRLALTAEYYFIPDKFKRQDNNDPLTIGLDIETGGHVFQLFFSSAAGVSERSLVTNTLSQWQKGQLHFGFNISRVFTMRYAR